MFWSIFNNLKNSSTRCEIGASMFGMLRPRATHLGVDNAATVGKGTGIIEHQRERNNTELKNERGGLKLGGKVSPLHRESPFRRKWHVMRDGDLWQGFQKFVIRKCPWAVWVSKVKGHATAEQVEAGVVKAADKEGNDKADTAADRASKDEQRYLAMIANIFSKRNKAYQDFARKGSKIHFKHEK